MFPVWLFFIIRQDAIALTLQALLPDMLCWCVFATLNRPMSRHTTTGKNMTNAVGPFFLFNLLRRRGIDTHSIHHYPPYTIVNSFIVLGRNARE
jgi:hypothetical protein